MSLFRTLKFILKHPLNRRHKMGALITFFRWQIGSRLVPGQVVYNWVNGSKMVVRPGETGFTQNIYCGLHEFPDMAYLLHVLSPGDLFVDIGANVGAYTILACAAKKAKGYCFEPVPSTFERLLVNIRINNLEKSVVSFNLGLSDREDVLFFTTGENCTNHVVANGEVSDKVVRVKVAPLDRILKGLFPSVLKIDVEGYETPVLSGAQKVLENESLHSVIMELNGSGSRYGFNEDKICKTMQGLGFLAYTYDPFSRQLESIAGKNIFSGNTLFIRNAEVIQKKVKAAPKVLVNSIWV